MIRPPPSLTRTATLFPSTTRFRPVELGKVRRIDDIIAGMNMVAEGVKSAPTVIALAEQQGLDMPIARDVFDVTQGRRSAQEVFRGLLRSRSEEHTSELQSLMRISYAVF